MIYPGIVILINIPQNIIPKQKKIKEKVKKKIQGVWKPYLQMSKDIFQKLFNQERTEGSKNKTTHLEFCVQQWTWWYNYTVTVEIRRLNEEECKAVRAERMENRGEVEMKKGREVDGGRDGDREGDTEISVKVASRS